MSFPVADWQFWVVTVSALGSVWMLVRPFLGPRGKAGGGSCAQCGVGAGAPCQGGRGSGSGSAPDSGRGSGAASGRGGGGRDRLVVIGGRR